MRCGLCAPWRRGCRADALPHPHLPPRPDPRRRHLRPDGPADQFFDERRCVGRLGLRGVAAARRASPVPVLTRAGAAAATEASLASYQPNHLPTPRWAAHEEAVNEKLRLQAERGVPTGPGITRPIDFPEQRYEVMW